MVFCLRVEEHQLVNLMPHRQDLSVTIDRISCSSIILKSLLESQTTIPNFGINNIIEYFIYCNDADGLEKQDLKNINSGGYKLFKEGHIHDIFTSSSSDTYLSKARCLPEMKKDT